MNNARLTKVLNENITNSGEYVLYWMQRSQRVEYNHALAYAIDVANSQRLPLLVVFVVTDHFLGANLRHYTFMFEGLREVETKLQSLGITFLLKYGDFAHVISDLAPKAHSVIFDYGYLKDERKWRREVLDSIINKKYPVNVAVVESDVIVPVIVAYDKVAYGAYVLRPQLMKKVDSYDDFSALPKIANSTALQLQSDLDLSNIQTLTNTLNIDTSVPPSPFFKGGYSIAKQLLADFLHHKYPNYPQRSDPSLSIQSYLSMYLHFGQISPLEIYQIVTQFPDSPSKTDFIEQLLVRRELAFNYVFYNKNYDQFNHMTEPWAYQSMTKHQDDNRPYSYQDDEIENSLTHDRYFNAAMKEMRMTGFMANYMRMYWAKQIMIWAPTYEHAYHLIVKLNNKYFIDGRDPNSYVNIAWIFGKMDRPWPERPIWGTIRSMNSRGLETKFNIDKYVTDIEALS